MVGLIARQTLSANGDQRQCLRNVRQVLGPFWGQRQLARTANEELDTERLLESDDAMADRARRHVQFGGGELEALVPAGRFEKPERREGWKAKWHHRPLFSSKPELCTVEMAV